MKVYSDTRKLLLEKYTRSGLDIPDAVKTGSSHVASIDPSVFKSLCKSKFELKDDAKPKYIMHTITNDRLEQ